MNEYVIETNRLFLRKIVKDDYSNICKILQNPIVMYAWEHGFSDEEVIEWIDKNLRRYEQDGFSYWAVIKKETNELIGFSGILKEKVEDKEYIGIGYIFDNCFWEKGFAFEASSACIGYAKEKLNLEKITAQIRPNNFLSIKLAEKLGMVPQKKFIKIYKGKEMLHILYEKELL